MELERLARIDVPLVEALSIRSLDRIELASTSSVSQQGHHTTAIVQELSKEITLAAAIILSNDILVGSKYYTGRGTVLTP